MTRVLRCVHNNIALSARFESRTNALLYPYIYEFTPTVEIISMPILLYSPSPAFCLSACRLNINRIRRRGVQTAALLNMRGKKDRQTLIVRVQ